MLLKFFHLYRTWWLQGLAVKYKAFCFQVSSLNMVQVGSARDDSHWVSVFDALCQMHGFPSPGRQVWITYSNSHTDTNCYPCWHVWSSQKFNGCCNWARCSQCSEQLRPWWWWASECQGLLWVKKSIRHWCCIVLQLACIKVMVAHADIYVLGERVNSWAILAGLVRGKCSPQGGQGVAWRRIN